MKKHFNFLFIVFLFSQLTLAQTALEDHLFKTDKIVTDGILIQKNGKTVYEKYNNGYSENSPHLLWSTTKSVAATIIAAAIQDGVITLDESVCANIEDKTAYSTCDITIRDLLSWSSGLQWAEEYEDGDPTKSSVVQMLAGDGKFDMLNFFLMHPLSSTPGSHYNYSTGDSTAMMGALKLALTKKGLNSSTYPWTSLFNPLGITQATLQTDKSGTFIGGAFAYMTAKDLIKIGELYANNGYVNGKQILPEWWTRFALSTVPSYDPAANARFLPQYSWWRFNPNRASKEIPADTFVTLGHWGQYLIVIPSKNIIAVRFGDDREASFNLDKMIVLMLAEFDKDSSMPSDSDAVPQIQSLATKVEEDKPVATPIYKSPLASLGSHYVARFVCACLFVSNQTEAYCIDYARTNPNIGKSKIDYENKTVESTFAGFAKAKAIFLNDQLGCQIVQ